MSNVNVAMTYNIICFQQSKLVKSIALVCVCVYKTQKLAINEMICCGCRRRCVGGPLASGIVRGARRW